MPKLLHLFLATAFLALAALVAGCQPSEEIRHLKRPTNEGAECRDQPCPGERWPNHDQTKEGVMKVNGQWYAGPKEYGVGPERQMAFLWPSRAPARGEAAASEAAKRPSADPYGQLIEIFFRSEDKLIDAKPQTPRANALMRLAEANGWISERTTLRKGLDRITMKPVETPWGTRIDHVTYFVATELRGADGLPPVATCSKADRRDGGGFGISWKEGVVVGARMSQYHCNDFPEVYIEAVRILNQLKQV